MAKRYEVRPEAEGRWSVVYTSTGDVVTVEGRPLNDLDQHEAQEAVDLLHAGELVSDVSDGP